MRVLSGARINSAEASRVEMALADGFRLILHFLDSHLARALIVPPGGLQMPRTSSLAPNFPAKTQSMAATAWIWPGFQAARCRPSRKPRPPSRSKRR